jgi:predicted amidohydrolase
MNANLRLLACQIEIPPVANKEEKTRHLNVVAEKIRAHLSETASGVDLIVLPELSSIDYSRAAFDSLPELAEDLDGESFSVYGQVAKEFDAFISYGLPRVENGQYYISQVVIAPNGEYLGHYDKLHIAHFGASMEKDYFRVGEQLLVFEVAGIKVAPVICYDLRFPELFRELCITRGVELIIHPVAFYRDASFPSWHHFAITRAMENQVYFLSLNRAGENYGSSIFCPPWIDHDIKSELLLKSEIFKIFEVDSDVLKQAQEIFPFRADVLENYANLD